MRGSVFVAEAIPMHPLWVAVVGPFRAQWFTSLSPRPPHRSVTLAHSKFTDSVASRRSFEAVNFIHDKLMTNLLGSTEAVARVLVGNKSDVQSHRYAAAHVIVCFRQPPHWL